MDNDEYKVADPVAFVTKVRNAMLRMEDHAKRSKDNETKLAVVYCLRELDRCFDPVA